MSLTKAIIKSTKLVTDPIGFGTLQLTFTKKHTLLGQTFKSLITPAEGLIKKFKYGKGSKLALVTKVDEKGVKYVDIGDYIIKGDKLNYDNAKCSCGHKYSVAGYRLICPNISCPYKDSTNLLSLLMFMCLHNKIELSLEQVLTYLMQFIPDNMNPTKLIGVRRLSDYFTILKDIRVDTPQRRNALITLFGEDAEKVQLLEITLKEKMSDTEFKSILFQPDIFWNIFKLPFVTKKEIDGVLSKFSVGIVLTQYDKQFQKALSKIKSSKCKASLKDNRNYLTDLINFILKLDLTTPTKKEK